MRLAADEEHIRAVFVCGMHFVSKGFSKRAARRLAPVSCKLPDAKKKNLFKERRNVLGHRGM